MAEWAGMRRRLALLAPLCVFLWCANARAQVSSLTTLRSSEDPLELRGTSGHLSLRIGMYLSTLATLYLDPPEPGTNGMSITNARIAFLGDLVGGFDYLFQLELTQEIPVLDLALGHSWSKALRLDVGLFKAPVSAEFLLPAANTDLINRARFVDALVPGRQVGLQLSGAVADGAFFYQGGLFNGNPGLNNADGGAMVALRAGTKLTLGSAGELTFAANAAVGDDQDLEAPTLAPTPGTRWIAGGDARLESGRLFAAFELLWGRFEPDLLPSFESWGYYATGGVTIFEPLVAIARWEHFDTGAEDLSDMLILSLASGVPGAAPINLQVDYVLPVSALDEQRVLINAYAVY